MKYLLVLLLSLAFAQQDPVITEGEDPTLVNTEGEEEIPPVTSSIIVDDVKYNCGNTNLIGET